MALRTITSRLCDRCGNTIEEISADVDLNDGESCEPFLALELNDEEKASILFADVCKKCQDRIHTLVGQLKLEKTAKEPRANGAGDAPTDTPTGPETEESADATA